MKSIAPFVIELNQGYNGELGPNMKQVCINYAKIRNNIMDKLKVKSREKYYQFQYGIPFKAEGVTENAEQPSISNAAVNVSPSKDKQQIKENNKPEENHDLYSDLDEFNK